MKIRVLSHLFFVKGDKKWTVMRSIGFAFETSSTIGCKSDKNYVFLCFEKNLSQDMGEWCLRRQKDEL